MFTGVVRMLFASLTSSSVPLASVRSSTFQVPGGVLGTVKVISAV